jgi:cellulose synthase/poly-beta-1,6-N-acetylglucosamine synthase-like glycosyltransferase
MRPLTDVTASPERAPSPRPLASIVIPTFRRPELLDRCLTAVTNQKLEGTRYEVVVVDDGPCDKTRAIVQSWSQRTPVPRIRYLVALHTQGPAAARNLGWRAAHGDIIAFTDDDCVPSLDWLTHGLVAFTDPIVAGAAGRVVVPVPSRPTDYERSMQGLETAEFVTANCFYRKSALEAVGGFDERFRKAWREDADLFFTLLEHGYVLWCQPEAVVLHPVRPARWGISLWLQQQSLYNALLYKKHPALYRARIQSQPPWRSYAIVLALTGMTVGGLAGSLAITGLGFSVWCALTARFAAMRLRGTSQRWTHRAEMLLTSALVPPLSVFWRLRGAMAYRVFYL